MKLIAFKLVISAFQSWLLKGQQNRSKMPINIFAKQIMFPAYETNFSTSFFIPANKLKIQHLFIWHLILNSCRTACIGSNTEHLTHMSLQHLFILHLILNSCRTACIGSLQDIWRIWAWSVCYRLGSNLVQELQLPNTAVKGQAYARGSILAGCAAISRVKFQGKHEK